MIQNIIEIPITKESYPFASADRYLHLDQYGYEEKEYYVDGTANVYQTVGDSGEVDIKNKDVSYRNRIIIRAPKDTQKFSGHVVVEIINPTSFMEIDRMWILGYRKFLRDGDIYVGITSKPNTIAKLVEFDEKRYNSLSWPNPTVDEPFAFNLEEAYKKGNLPDIDIHYEIGLFWDMLTDLAWTLRDNTSLSPLQAYSPKYIHLTGWSQSAAYLVRYVNSFAYRTEVKKDGRVFDGYFAGGCVRHWVIPVNQYEVTYNYNYKLTRVEHVEEPFISMQTESENSQMNAYSTERRDSDQPDFLYRNYEVTGSSHDTMYNYVNYYQNDPDLIRINHLPSYAGLHEEANDYPSQVLFAAGFKNLFRWVEEGVGPNSCERIKINGRGINQKDAFGNTIGGLRTCLLNYPTGIFNSTSTVKVGTSIVNPNSDKDILFGYQKPFSSSTLKELYGSLVHYKELCIQDTKEQISKGFVCKEDLDYLVDIAVNLAKERGLQ